MFKTWLESTAPILKSWWSQQIPDIVQFLKQYDPDFQNMHPEMIEAKLTDIKKSLTHMGYLDVANDQIRGVAAIQFDHNQINVGIFCPADATAANNMITALVNKSVPRNRIINIKMSFKAAQLAKQTLKQHGLTTSSQGNHVVATNAQLPSGSDMERFG